ncbi:MAG: hypothetical protein JXA07_06065 [Spirochaetes bacterium]|nr:hypothetical protein [Spirochaetota bacterium]
MKIFGTALNIIAGLFNFFGSFLACAISWDYNTQSSIIGWLAFLTSSLLLVGAGMTVSNKKITLMIGSIIVIITSICGLVLVNVFFLFGIVSIISGSFTLIASFEINKKNKIENINSKTSPNKA